MTRPIVQMGPEYTPLLSELLRDPLIRHGFTAWPTEVAWWTGAIIV